MHRDSHRNICTCGTPLLAVRTRRLSTVTFDLAFCEGIVRAYMMHFGKSRTPAEAASHGNPFRLSRSLILHSVNDSHCLLHSVHLRPNGFSIKHLQGHAWYVLMRARYFSGAGRRSGTYGRHIYAVACTLCTPYFCAKQKVVTP